MVVSETRRMGRRGILGALAQGREWSHGVEVGHPSRHGWQGMPTRCHLRPMSLVTPSGIFSAQWIPTDALGRIDRPSLAAHIEFEQHAGISGMLALGSTGEFPHFTVDERKSALATIAELAAPLPVLANISDIRPRAAIELGRHAETLGLPAVALMPPVFFPVSQADMLAYFL